MGMEELNKYLAVVTREVTEQRAMAAAIIVLAFAVVWLLAQPYIKRLSAYRRGKRMNQSREKVINTKISAHTIGMLRFMVKDGEITLEEAVEYVQKLGKRMLPEIVPDGKLLKDELVEKTAVATEPVLPSFLSKLKVRNA